MTGGVNDPPPTHMLRNGRSDDKSTFAFFHTYIKEQTAVQILPFCYLTAFAGNSSRNDTGISKGGKAAQNTSGLKQENGHKGKSYGGHNLISPHSAWHGMLK